MKHIALLVISHAFGSLVLGQSNSIQEGNSCFTKGDYACAIEKYREAINSPDERQKKIASDNLKQAERCFELSKMADAAYNSKNFTKAKEYYQSILNENTKDEYANTRLVDIQNKLMAINMPNLTITGNINIGYGESTTLKVEGGVLGNKAVWKWYTKSCGGEFVATGESIKIKPVKDELYFVRAESLTDISGCLTVSVKVDTNSKSPDRIDGKKSFCLNEKNIPLTVSGGRLGKGAQWSWYQDSLKGKHLGYGQVILVSPVKKTTYYLIAEGGPNLISPLTFEMNIADEKLTEPENISGINFVCKGTSLELNLVGGTIPPDASWTWYKDNINKTNEVGRGRKIKVYPESNTKYLVRGEGSCTVTNIKSIDIEVGQTSTPPISIQQVNDPNNKRKTRLTIYGGSLAKNAKWVWLTDDCNSKNQTGTGEQISVKPKKRTTYYVKGIGECNSTSCISTTLNPRLPDKYFFINFGTIIPSSEKNFNSGSKIFGENAVYSLSLGKLSKTGWYIRAKFNNPTIAKDYNIENNQITGPSGSYFVYNNEIAYNRLSATAGITKRLGRIAFLLFGAGYGQRELLWGVDEYSNSSNSYIKSGWGNNYDAYYEGPEAEAGLLVKLSIFNVSLGINSIVYNIKSSSNFNQKTYFDYHIGIGLTF